jgi:hypothetical protein
LLSKLPVLNSTLRPLYDEAHHDDDVEIDPRARGAWV